MAQKEKPLILAPEPIRAPRREREERDRDSGSRDSGSRDSRGDRGRDRDRGERSSRERDRPARQPRSNVNMDTFRIEVGRDDGVQVKNVVGAIANEGNLDSQFIGGIRLHDNYTTVELPSDMPKETMDHLFKAFVCSKPMKLTRLQAGTLPDDRPRRTSRDSNRDGGAPRSSDRGHRGQRDDKKGGSRDSRPPRRDRS